jgi:hypothetical protein
MFRKLRFISPEIFLIISGLPSRLPYIAMIVSNCKIMVILFVYKMIVYRCELLEVIITVDRKRERNKYVTETKKKGKEQTKIDNTIYY